MGGGGAAALAATIPSLAASYAGLTQVLDLHAALPFIRRQLDTVRPIPALRRVNDPHAHAHTDPAPNAHSDSYTHADPVSDPDAHARPEPDAVAQTAPGWPANINTSDTAGFAANAASRAATDGGPAPLEDGIEGEREDLDVRSSGHADGDGEGGRQEPEDGHRPGHVL